MNLITTMRLSLISYASLFSCFLFFTLTRSKPNEVLGMLMFDINGEHVVLPLLDGLKTQHEFPMMDIEWAEFFYSPDSAACLIWSDKDFDYVPFYSEYVKDFPNANRLICFDEDDVGVPMMVEDMSGNRELVTLDLDSPDYFTAKLKRVMHIKRAVPLYGNYVCRFRSKQAFSEEFDYEGLSEPFRGAFEVYCRNKVLVSR